MGAGVERQLQREKLKEQLRGRLNVKLKGRLNVKLKENASNM